MNYYISGDHPIVGMQNEEVKTVEKYLMGSKDVLEWGSGGSTIYFPKFINGKYVSIEHNRSWYDKIKPQISDNVEYYYVPYHHIKLDSKLDKVAPDFCKYSMPPYTTRNWVTKVDNDIWYCPNGDGHDWHESIDYINKPLTLETKKYDIVIVDGRSRRYCAYNAINLMSENSYLLFHDFNNRVGYRGVLKYFDIVEICDTLAVMKLKTK